MRLGLERAAYRAQLAAEERGQAVDEEEQERGGSRSPAEGGRGDIRAGFAEQDGGGNPSEGVDRRQDGDGRGSLADSAGEEPRQVAPDGTHPRDPDTRALRTECVWYCDSDKYAVETYNRNFGEQWQPTDVRSVDPRSLRDFEVLFAGFPCPAYSLAGKRRGFDDPRGALFFEIARVVEIKRPRLLVLENVKGLLSHDKGRTFKIILATLDELGYDLEWELLNSRYYGVPQNRERVFIVGHSRAEPSPKIFPLGQSGGGAPGTPEAPQGEGPRVGAIGSQYYKGGARDVIQEVSGVRRQSGRVYDSAGVAPTLQSHGPSGGHAGPTIREISGADQQGERAYDAEGLSPALREYHRGVPVEIHMIPHGKEEGGTRVREDTPALDNAGSRFVVNATNPHNGKESRGLHKSDVTRALNTFGKQQESLVMLSNHSANTKQREQDRETTWVIDTTGNNTGVKDGQSFRRLTPLECERLQGFPDNWTLGQSDTQRYRQMGNAVTVNVVEAICEVVLKKCLS